MGTTLTLVHSFASVSTPYDEFCPITDYKYDYGSEVGRRRSSIDKYASTFINTITTTTMMNRE
jgi:hypothetical protein